MHYRILIVFLSLVLLTAGITLIGSATEAVAVVSCLLPNDLYLPVVIGGGGSGGGTAAEPLYADFNGDGCADLAIGAPSDGPGGAVTVLYGSAAGLFGDTAQLWDQDSAGVPGVSEGGDQFGKALAAGDFDDDGYWDLAIGVPWEDVDGIDQAGAVNVLYGSAAGLSSAGAQLWHQDSAGVPGANEVFDLFGSALAAADFDGDGSWDLAIGIVGESVEGAQNAGAVNVLYGSAAGLSSAGTQRWHQDSPGIPGDNEGFDQFGTSLAAGDFDNDGYWDVAIGIPGEEIDGILRAGAVNVLYGSALGLSGAGAQAWHPDTPGIQDINEKDDRFGQALAAGDFGGDGYWDLAIGVPGKDRTGAVNAGGVHILYGSAAGLAAAGNQLWHQNSTGVPGANEAGDQFGWALAAGDFDGDGNWDLTVGVPLEDIGGILRTGAVNVLYGSAAGLSAAGAQGWHQDSPGVPGANEIDDRFGSALAAGDFDHDGSWDLAIGVPDEDAGVIENSGGVYVLYGSAAGLAAAGAQGWHQNIPGVPGDNEAGDRFGYSLR